MLTINAAQWQVFAHRARDDFLARLWAAHGAALAVAKPPLDPAGLAVFVEACCGVGVRQEDAVALLVSARASRGEALFASAAVGEILTDPALDGRIKAYQVHLLAEHRP